jgi:hypothetical protein
MYIFNKTWCIITLTCTNYLKYESIINTFKFHSSPNTNTSYLVGGNPATWSPTGWSSTNITL